MKKLEKEQDLSATDNILIVCSLFYLLLTTTRLFSFWNDNINIYNVDVSMAVVDTKVVVFGNLIGLYLLVYFFQRKTEAMLLVRKNQILFFLFVFSLVSCLWSQLPFVAFKRWLKVFYLLIMAINILNSQSPINSLRKILFGYTRITLIISLLFILFFPKYGWMSLQGEYLPKGIFVHKNELANIAALAIMLTVWVEYNYVKSFKQIIWRNWFWTGGWLVCLFISKGKTSLGGFLVAISLYLVILFAPGRKKQDLRAVIAAVFLLASTCLLYTCLSNVNVYELVMGDILNIAGKDKTFTGRTQIWTVLIDLGIENHPILGSGFKSFFLGNRSLWLLNFLTWNAPDSHNSFIQIFLELGLVGVVTFICLNISMVAKIFKKIFYNGDNSDIMTLSIIFFLLFCGMFEANLAFCNSFAFFAFLVIILFKDVKVISGNAPNIIQV